MQKEIAPFLGKNISSIAFSGLMLDIYFLYVPEFITVMGHSKFKRNGIDEGTIDLDGHVLLGMDFTDTTLSIKTDHNRFTFDVAMPEGVIRNQG